MFQLLSVSIHSLRTYLSSFFPRTSLSRPQCLNMVRIALPVESIFICEYVLRSSSMKKYSPVEEQNQCSWNLGSWWNGKGEKKESRVSGLLLRLSWKLLSLTTCTSIYSVRFCKNLLGFLSKGFTHMKTCFHHDQAITPAPGNNHIWICVNHHTYRQ